MSKSAAHFAPIICDITSIADKRKVALPVGLYSIYKLPANSYDVCVHGDFIVYHCCDDIRSHTQRKLTVARISDSRILYEKQYTQHVEAVCLQNIPGVFVWEQDNDTVSIRHVSGAEITLIPRQFIGSLADIPAGERYYVGRFITSIFVEQYIHVFVHTGAEIKLFYYRVDYIPAAMQSTRVIPHTMFATRLDANWVPTTVYWDPKTGERPSHIDWLSNLPAYFAAPKFATTHGHKNNIADILNNKPVDVIGHAFTWTALPYSRKKPHTDNFILVGVCDGYLPIVRKSTGEYIHNDLSLAGAVYVGDGYYGPCILVNSAVYIWTY